MKQVLSLAATAFVFFCLLGSFEKAHSESSEYQMVHDAICQRALRDSNDPVAQYLDTGLVSSKDFLEASLDAFKQCVQSGNISEEHFWKVFRKVTDLAGNRPVYIFLQLDLVSLQKSLPYFGRQFLPAIGGRDFVRMPMTPGQLAVLRSGFNQTIPNMTDFYHQFPDLNLRDCLGFPPLFYFARDFDRALDVIKHGADPTIEVPYVKPDTYNYALVETLTKVDNIPSKVFPGYDLPCRAVGDTNAVMSTYAAKSATIPVWYWIIQYLTNVHDNSVVDRPQVEKDLLREISKSVKSVPPDFFVSLAKTQNLRLFPTWDSDREFIRDLIAKGANLNATFPDGSTLLKKMSMIGYDGKQIKEWQNLGAHF